jgi:hypothetical protein
MAREGEWAVSLGKRRRMIRRPRGRKSKETGELVDLKRWEKGDDERGIKNGTWGG